MEHTNEAGDVALSFVYLPFFETQYYQMSFKYDEVLQQNAKATAGKMLVIYYA